MKDRRRALIQAVAVLAVLGVGFIAAFGDPFTVAFYATYAITGANLVILRPRNIIGWIMVGIAWGFIGTTTSPTIDVAALQGGTAPLDQELAAWFNGWAGYAAFTGFLALALVFPEGRLPTGRWRGIAAGLLVAGVLTTVLYAFAPTISVNPNGSQEVLLPNPFAIAPGWTAWTYLPPGLGVPVIILLVAVALIGLVARYRRATGIVRLQLRWLVAALALIVVAIISAFAIMAVADSDLGGAVWLPAVVAYPMIPVAVVVAVLRYRLLEIDRIISRTIAYAGVTLTLFVVFSAVNLVAQTLLGTVVRGNTAAVAISTLTVAALFNPVRVRLQRLVDRRFNRGRVDQERTVSAFATSLRGDLDVDRLIEHLRVTVDLAVEPRAVSVWERQQVASR
jgi:hypothetical protein